MGSRNAVWQMLEVLTVQWAGIGADWTYYRSSKIHVLPRATATVAVALRSATATCRSGATPA